MGCEEYTRPIPHIEEKEKLICEPYLEEPSNLGSLWWHNDVINLQIQTSKDAAPDFRHSQSLYFWCLMFTINELQLSFVVLKQKMFIVTFYLCSATRLDVNVYILLQLLHIFDAQLLQEHP